MKYWETYDDRYDDIYRQEQCEEEEAALARASERGDGCPTCGRSLSEHDEAQMNGCVAAYEENSMFISKVIDEHLRNRAASDGEAAAEEAVREVSVEGRR